MNVAFIQSLQQGKRAPARVQLGTRLLLAASILPSCRQARGSTTPRGSWAPAAARSSRNSSRCGVNCCSSSSAFEQSKLCSGRNRGRWIEKRRMQQSHPCTLVSLRKVSLLAMIENVSTRLYEAITSSTKTIF